MAVQDHPIDPLVDTQRKHCVDEESVVVERESEGRVHPSSRRIDGLYLKVLPNANAMGSVKLMHA